MLINRIPRLEISDALNHHKFLSYKICNLTKTVTVIAYKYLSHVFCLILFALILLLITLE